eukprot:m.1273781 g.1273781  ORF g.1273781 m.1273781 type:complete len:50 (+) comp24755_c1_seq28:1339-1488(+)
MYFSLIAENYYEILSNAAFEVKETCIVFPASSYLAIAAADVEHYRQVTC